MQRLEWNQSPDEPVWRTLCPSPSVSNLSDPSLEPLALNLNSADSIYPFTVPMSGSSLYSPTTNTFCPASYVAVACPAT